MVFVLFYHVSYLDTLNFNYNFTGKICAPLKMPIHKKVWYKKAHVLCVSSLYCLLNPVWFSNILALSEPDEDYSRKSSCVLNLICMFSFEWPDTMVVQELQQSVNTTRIMFKESNGQYLYLKTLITNKIISSSWYAADWKWNTSSLLKIIQYFVLIRIDAIVSTRQATC